MPRISSDVHVYVYVYGMKKKSYIFECKKSLFALLPICQCIHMADISGRALASIFSVLSLEKNAS